MPRGGPRPNSGRPRKDRTASAAVLQAVAAVEKSRPDAESISTVSEPSDMTPLGFLLAVMRDDKALMADRFRAATAALPFVHQKPEAASEGIKKKRQAKAEENAASGKFAARPGPRLVASRNSA